MTRQGKGISDRHPTPCETVLQVFGQKQSATSLRGDGENDWTKGCYYDKYPREIYKPRNIDGGHPQQINVEVGGKIVDIASISPIVASVARFGPVREAPGQLLSCREPVQLLGFRFSGS